jgi:quercetin dioxygenase-like cupin family protein
MMQIAGEKARRISHLQVKFPTPRNRELIRPYQGFKLAHQGSFPPGVVEFAPGGAKFKHRTETLDYAICLKGECDLELDDGRTVPIKAGDICVQRGTMHAWVAKGSEAAVFAFVLIDAEPVEKAGKKLTTHYATDQRTPTAVLSTAFGTSTWRSPGLNDNRENAKGAGPFLAFQRLYLAAGGVNFDRSQAVQPKPRKPGQGASSSRSSLFQKVIRRWLLRQLGVSGPPVVE